MTKKYRFRFVAAFLAALCMAFSLPKPVTAAEPPKETTLYSKACVLMDGDSGRVLFGKNETLALANASTTKILTAIVCLERAGGDEIVTASKKAASQPKVHLGMKEGEQFYVEDLLYAMMLESFNDCAMALAEHVGGSMEGFSALLNEKAAQIGCKDTYFITPNGLDAEDETGFHHTTAADLGLLMKYCCWDSPMSGRFLEITQTGNHSFSSLDGKSYSVSNKNAFLSMMPESISGKTGFTSAAGYCYVAAAESEGRKYTIALLACGWPNHRTYKWSDAKTLFGYGMDNFRIETVDFPKEEYTIEVVNGRMADATIDDWGKAVVLRAAAEKCKDSRNYLLSGEETFCYETDLAEKLYHSPRRGDIVGKISCYLGEDRVEECGIVVEESCFLWDFGSFFKCMLKAFFVM